MAYSKEELVAKKAVSREGFVGSFEGFDPVWRSQVPGLLALESEVPGEMFNTVYSTRIGGEQVKETVEAYVKGLTARNVPSMWLVWPDSEPQLELEEALVAAGYHLSEEAPMMTHDLQDLPKLNLPDGITIQPADTDDAVVLWSDVGCEAFGWNPPAIPTGNEYRKHLLKSGEGRHFVLYEDGKPCACSFVKYDDQVSEIAVIATHSSARRKGYGRALTLHLLHEIKAYGSDLAYLEASPEGLPVYQKLGFKAFEMCREFHRPL